MLLSRYFREELEQTTQGKACLPGRAPWGPAGLQFLSFFLILLSLEENKFLNKKRNKSSEKEVNHKLDRGTSMVRLPYKRSVGPGLCWLCACLQVRWMEGARPADTISFPPAEVGGCGEWPGPAPTDLLSLLFPFLKDGGCTCPGDVAKAFGKRPWKGGSMQGVGSSLRGCRREGADTLGEDRGQS